MSKCYLVSGAAGFIAFHLISDLLAKGCRVVGVDNFDPFYDRKVKEANVEDLKCRAKEFGATFDFYELNFSDASALKTIPLMDFNSVIHLGAKAGVRPSLLAPQSYVDTNIIGTINLLEWAVSMGIRQFVFGSSSSVYGESEQVPFSENFSAMKPISPYAATKRACELFCETYSKLYSLNIASLRFFTVYGQRQRPDLAIHLFTKKILASEEIVLFGDGSAERDYTHVSDIVDGVVGAMRWVEDGKAGKHEVFNLGGSKTITLINLVRIIEILCQKKAKVVWAGAQPGDVSRTYADISKSMRYLGYSPKVRIESGLEDFVSWMRAEMGL